MSKIKRINLCFNINRTEDREVYNMLKKKRNKTAYVVDTILRTKKLEDNTLTINTDILKSILKEVLDETSIVINSSENDKKANKDIDIPNEVFNIIESI